MKLTLEDIKLVFLSKPNIVKIDKSFLELIKDIEKPEGIDDIKKLYNLYKMFFTKVIKKEFEENIPDKLQSMVVYLVTNIIFLVENSKLFITKDRDFRDYYFIYIMTIGNLKDILTLSDENINNEVIDKIVKLNTEISKLNDKVSGSNNSFPEYLFPTQEQFDLVKSKAKDLIDKYLDCIDTDIRDFIVYLNSFTGIATRFSCQGHPDNEEKNYFYIHLVVTLEGFNNLCKIYKIFKDSLDSLQPNKLNSRLDFVRRMNAQDDWINLILLNANTTTEKEFQNVQLSIKKVMEEIRTV